MSRADEIKARFAALPPEEQTPRAIRAGESWTFISGGVTCPKCKAILVQRAILDGAREGLTP